MSHPDHEMLCSSEKENTRNVLEICIKLLTEKEIEISRREEFQFLLAILPVV
jgi:hypothetical protein